MKRILGCLVVSGLALGAATAHADKVFNAGKGATWDCAKDPDVTINASGGSYTLHGACKGVDVKGNGNNVTVESVEDITINGNKNTVGIGAVDDLDVNGNGNTVTWKTSLRSGKPPKISSPGNGNTVTGGTASASASASASDATILDCAKQSNVSITKGNGSYRITGACDKVAISGGTNKVAIEAAKNLSITGSSNEVVVDKVDKIATIGSHNKVSYGGGLTLAAPKLATMGKGNAIAHASAAVAPSSAAPSTTGPTDCSKQATHTIDTNGGSYVFIGTCERITVTGNDNSIVIESAKTVTVPGNENKLSIAAVDSLTIPGNANAATWKRGVSSAKPTVSARGNDNHVVQVK